jgi:hypothetical protein
VRSGRIILAGIALVALVAIVAAATGRFPELVEAWDSLSSIVASPSTSATGERGDAGDRDAAAASADSGAQRRQTAALSSAQLGAPLVHGSFVTSCGAPDTMKVVVKADVKMGRAVAVDVKTDPPDPTIAACIERAARDLKWDISPKTGHVTVTY